MIHIPKEELNFNTALHAEDPAFLARFMEPLNEKLSKEKCAVQSRNGATFHFSLNNQGLQLTNAKMPGDFKRQARRLHGLFLLSNGGGDALHTLLQANFLWEGIKTAFCDTCLVVLPGKELTQISDEIDQANFPFLDEIHFLDPTAPVDDLMAFMFQKLSPIAVQMANAAEHLLKKQPPQ